MDVYETLNDVYNNCKKLIVAHFASKETTLESILEGYEYNFSFNLVLWIKRSHSLSCGQVLNKIDHVLSSYESIIPFIYIELKLEDFTEYHNWAEKKTFFQYLRIVPVFIVENRERFGEILQKGLEYETPIIGFYLSELSGPEILELLDFIQDEQKTESIMIFLHLNILKQVQGYQFRKYTVPIHVNPAGDSQ